MCTFFCVFFLDERRKGPKPLSFTPSQNTSRIDFTLLRRREKREREMFFVRQYHGKTGCSTSGRTAFSESTAVVLKKETARRVRKTSIDTTRRIQAQSVDNIREKAKKDSREGVPKHENNFNAKYVPFASSDKSETYSLDEVIYRSKNGGLLDVEHDMEALGKYPPGT